ncbi:hypothetical protein M3Y99_00279400 [Aphelenchoides fujianensis]|nr:hypothetical protein M3Y99_00279400 [Aphelenchoides fujianensis]
MERPTEMPDEKLSQNGSNKPEKRIRERPIYRPPGLRSPLTSTPQRSVQEVVEKTVVSPTVERKEVDQASNASSESRSTGSDQRKAAKRAAAEKAEKKKTLSSKEVDEIRQLVKLLDLGGEREAIEKFVAEKMEDERAAANVAHSLARYAIEEKRRDQRPVARLCCLLMDAPAGAAFLGGLVDSIRQYFECRAELRSSHLRVWTDFLAFASDVYANVDPLHHESALMDVIFDSFDYLLKSPILETLKIEELEVMISALLQVGNQIERTAPHKLVELKETIRNALLEVAEPWARKMILLLMELGASNFVLPPEANEYYFQ